MNQQEFNERSKLFDILRSSPLVSGVDGSYQATARGKNRTGVFRFMYANGVQTSNPQLPTATTVPNLLTDPYNDYVFFAEGKVIEG